MKAENRATSLDRKEREKHYHKKRHISPSQVQAKEAGLPEAEGRRNRRRGVSAGEGNHSGRGRQDRNAKKQNSKGFPKRSKKTSLHERKFYYDMFGSAQNKKYRSRKRIYQVKSAVLKSRNIPKYKCFLCSGIIKEPLNAISVPKNQDPAHFECILEHLESKHNLVSGQAIAYLGSGRFAVVEGPQRKVVSLIDFNVAPIWPEWRCGLSSPVIEAAVSIYIDA